MEILLILLDGEKRIGNVQLLLRIIKAFSSYLFHILIELNVVIFLIKFVNLYSLKVSHFVCLFFEDETIEDVEPIDLWEEEVEVEAEVHELLECNASIFFSSFIWIYMFNLILVVQTFRLVMEVMEGE